MPLKYFIHPRTGERLLIKDCLDKGLLSEFYPLSYLNRCSMQREWDGIPSTTQLLKGTRQTYLELFYDWAENPDNSIFKILGAGTHEILEKFTINDSLAEIKMSRDEITGIADLIEKQLNGEIWLIDHKVIGAFSIKKTLGIIKKKRLMKDDNGNQVCYLKSGKWGKAGDPKYEDYYVIDPSQADYGTYYLQLNRYRIALEKSLKIKISKLKIFAIPRETDKNTVARYGIEARPYYIDIPMMPDKEVNDYFFEKRDKLLHHVNLYQNEINLIKEKYSEEMLIKYIPEPCNTEESWGGRRCKGYCNVSEICQKAGCHWIKEGF